MAEREIHKTTPEERERICQRADDAERRLPEFLERADRRAQAIQEKGLNGQLRRAIADSHLPYPELSKRSGVGLAELANFMTGEAPLDLESFAQLAAALNYELLPAGESKN